MYEKKEKTSKNKETHKDNEQRVAKWKTKKTSWQWTKEKISIVIYNLW